jgi:RNA polymerase sigma factor (sigma-70 family)
VAELLDKWQWIDRMNTAEQKQRFLEPLIEAVRREPTATEHLVIFLMLVFEPVRRSVSKAFVAACSGMAPQQRDVNWGSREEARMIRHVERQQLFDVTREAALEAVFRYPSPAPPRFFLWLRETIAHRALDKLRADLPEVDASAASAEEAEAIQAALAGFERADAPTMRDRRGVREWRNRINMRDVFDVVEEFFAHDPVRDACRIAVGRLPHRQRDAIDRYFFDELDVPEIAAQRGVSSSTIYNQKASAQNALHRDEVFFSALYSLRRVRDRALLSALCAPTPTAFSLTAVEWCRWTRPPDTHSASLTSPLASQAHMRARVGEHCWEERAASFVIDPSAVPRPRIDCEGPGPRKAGRDHKKAAERPRSYSEAWCLKRVPRSGRRR